MINHVTGTTYTTTSDGKLTVASHSKAGKCEYGHAWTYSGNATCISEGMLCDCGAERYQLPKYCSECGHQL